MVPGRGPRFSALPNRAFMIISSVFTTMAPILEDLARSFDA